MRFGDFYGKGRPIISFELFPPRTEKGTDALKAALPRLIELEPDFLTVTYGALGNTQEGTLDVVSTLKNQYGKEAAHHLTCVGLARNDIDEALTEIRRHNIENIVAIRGDPPKGDTDFKPPEGGYGHADQLVEHIRSFGEFGIAVAGYPETHTEASDTEADIQFLKRKVDLGADVVITQLFYDNSDFYSFEARCRSVGIDLPIVAGLMPILDTQQIQRITNMCGARIPPFLMDQLVDAGDDKEQVHLVGIKHAADQATDLLEHGVAGIHFYVLNQHSHIADIMARIRPLLGDGRHSVA